MNLFRNRNNIDKKLKSKFENFEVKPQDSLWERIADDLPENNLEKAIRQKVDSYHTKPDEEMWLRIAQELEREEVHSNWWKYAPVLVLFVIASTAFVFINNEINKGAMRKAEIAQKETPTKYREQNAPQMPFIEAEMLPKTKPALASEHNVLPTRRQVPGINSLAPTLEKNTSPIAQNTETPKAKANQATHHLPTPTANTNSMANTNLPSTAHASNNAESSKSSTSLENKQQPQDAMTLYIAEADEKAETITSIDSLQNSHNIDNNTGTDASSHIIAPSALIKDDDDDDTPSRITIGVLGGVNYCMMALKSPESNRYPLVENTMLRQSIERPQLDLAVHFVLQYDINENWKISAGFGRLLFRQTFFYNITSPSTPNDEAIENPSMINQGDSIINGNRFRSDIRYSWTEVPITIHYQKILSRRLELNLQGGISYAILSNVDMAMVNYDNIGVLLINNKNDFPSFGNSFFAHCGAGFLYTINSSVKLSVQPQYRFSLNNMVKNANWVEQRPSLLGIQIGILKKI
jgi:hypothetical protein